MFVNSFLIQKSHLIFVQDTQTPPGGRGSRKRLLFRRILQAVGTATVQERFATERRRAFARRLRLKRRFLIFPSV